MRILVVVHGFPPAAQGGSEVYAHAHARALASSGDDILVLTRDHDASRPDYGVRTEQCDGFRVLRINNTFRLTRSFEETYANEAIDAIAREAIDSFRPDAAHIHHLTCLSTGIVRLLAERRVPAVLTIHDYWLMCHRGQLLDVNYRVCDGPDASGACASCLGPAGSAGSIQFAGARALRAVERRLPGASANLLRRAATGFAGLVHDRPSGDQERRRTAHMRRVCDDIAHFIAPSRSMRDRFVSFGISPERITVADYGFDRASFDRFRPVVARPFQGRHVRLGFLGSLMISKGPHVLLEAIRGLPAGTVSVDLFGAHTSYHGDDSYRGTLAPLADHPAVRVRGPIAHDAVPAALASLDALVVPSIWPENSPLVIHEAFLAGVPVIASRIGGIPELVADGQGGLLFNPHDAADLCRVINRLLTEPNLLDELRATIPSVRTIEDDVRMARELYRSLRLSAKPLTAERRRLAAVVLNFRTPDDTLLAVKSVLASRRPIDDVIVVDNDSIENARHRLRDVPSSVRYLLTGRNLGFSGGMNAGIREALARGADSVLLVNSDVIVPPDCVERLERCLEVHQAGVTGPVVLARSEPGWVASLGMSYAARTGRMRHRGVGTQLRDRASIDTRHVDAVSGCLMLIRREVFDAIGLFDEDFFFSFEEIDFCLRARRAGFATVLDGSAVVYHEGGRSIGPDAPARLYFAARNHLLLASRHGGTRRLRTLSVVALNVAHAVRTSGASLPRRLSAVARGVRDHAAGRFGPA